jgi:bacillithiol biosynthesis cysteine-adding enzyme BshC
VGRESSVDPQPIVCRIGVVQRQLVFRFFSSFGDGVGGGVRERFVSLGARGGNRRPGEVRPSDRFLERLDECRLGGPGHGVFGQRRRRDDRNDPDGRLGLRFFAGKRIVSRVLERRREGQRRLEAIRRLGRHAADQHGMNAVHPRGRDTRRQRSYLMSESCRTPRREELVGDRGQGEHVGRRAPGHTGNAFRRTVGPAHRRPEPDALQRLHHPEPGGSRLVRRHEDVAGMQPAVPDPGGPGEIDGAGQLGDERQHRLDRRRRVVPQGHVERLGRDVLLRAVSDAAFDPGRYRFDDRGVEEPGAGSAGQLVGQGLRLLRREIDPEGLHRDEPIAFRLVGTEDRSERADPYLMQDPEGAELRRCGEWGWVVSGQGMPRGIEEIYHRIRGQRAIAAEPARPAPPGILRTPGRVESRVGYLDMVKNALREYGPVPADASTTATPPSPARTAIDVRRLPWVRPLAGDYAFNFPNVAPLYAGDPASDEAWREAADRSRAHARAGTEVAACVASQQSRREAPPAARAAAQALADPHTVAVVTGQQAGAAGGPLFTLLKAITAVQLARRAESLVGGRVVPIFWVDAEDHDWKEVASVTVLDGQYQPHTIELPAPEGAGTLPVAAITLDDSVSGALDALEAALTRTDFTDSVMASLRQAYRPGIGMADAFARWLEGLLGPHGLVVFEASDAAIKPLLADLFGREIATPGRTAALAVEAGATLTSRGHAPQVVPQPDSLSLFRLDGARKPIKRSGDRFVAGDTEFTAAELAAEAASTPDRFSPNVLLRPIVQDTLFPTICYVAGPSELAYLGQLREVYAHFGVPMPLIHPRATATLTDSATARFLAKYSVRLEDLQPQDDSTLNRLLQAQLPQAVEDAVTDAEAAIQRAMERVIEAVPAVDPTLAGAARTTLGKMEHELRALHGKVIQAAKRRDDTLRRQFTRARAQTFPDGHPQERALSVLYFLNLYGPALIDRLFQELPLDLGQHWVITI